MSWELAAAIAEIISAVAVVISLVYLAVQIKSNTTQLKFNEGHAIADSADRGFEPIYSEPAMSIWTKGHRDIGQLTDDERTIFDALMIRNIQNFQNMILARRESLIDEEVFHRTLVGFYTPLINSPGGAEWFEDRKDYFIDEVSEILSKDG